MEMHQVFLGPQNVLWKDTGMSSQEVILLETSIWWQTPESELQNSSALDNLIEVIPMCYETIK